MTNRYPHSASILLRICSQVFILTISADQSITGLKILKPVLPGAAGLANLPPFCWLLLVFLCTSTFGPSVLCKLQKCFCAIMYIHLLLNCCRKPKAQEFIRDAVETRLRMIVPYIDTWPQAMAIQALPQNAVESWTNLANLVDEIWYYAGDRSVDVSGNGSVSEWLTVLVSWIGLRCVH